MREFLYKKAAIVSDFFLGKEFRTIHPVKAYLVDAAVLATATCWLLGVLMLMGESI